MYVLGKFDFWTGSGDVNGYFGREARIPEKHASGMKVMSVHEQAAVMASTLPGA